MFFADITRSQARPFSPVGIPVGAVPLSVATRATGCFSTLPILPLVGDVLIFWYVSHKPRTLPQIKEILDDEEDMGIVYHYCINFE